MTKPNRFIILLAAGAFQATVGCSSNNFNKPSQLNSLRVLALVVDKPYVMNPSGTTTISLQPYVSDIGGTGDLSVVVQSCVDPGVSSTGPFPDCTNGTNASATQNVTIAASTASSAGVFGNPERTGAPSSAISVPLTIPSGFLSAYSPQLQFNGVPYIITFTVSNGTTTVKAYRQIYISNQATDSNPSLSDLFSNGASLTSLPTGTPNLSASISGSPTSYNVMSAAGSVASVTQVYKTSWYISDGTLSADSTTDAGSTAWTPPGQEPSGRKAVVVGVLRNGRGGESVVIKLL